MKPTLFVSFSKRGCLYIDDASARYRCVFQAEKIRSQGGLADVIHISDIRAIDLKPYKRIICHRPFYCKRLNFVKKQAERFKMALVADFDDQLFRPDLCEFSPTVLSGKESAKLARSKATRYLKALKIFKLCRLSTNNLIQSARLIHPYCSYKLVHNEIPFYWVNKASDVPLETRLEKKIIRYFPGTSNHSTNFEKIAQFLAALLMENPDFSLEVIGTMNLDQSIFPEKQLVLRPYMRYEELPKMIASSWITIAPLEYNPFNLCKSGLKFWESGVFGVPVIASNNSDMKRLENKGLLLSGNLHEWKAYILKMTSKQNYKIASEAAKISAKKSIITPFQYTPSQSHMSYPPSFNIFREKDAPRTDKSLKESERKIRRKLNKLKNNPRAFFNDARSKIQNNKRS